jgi:hypothetical protein
LAAAQMPMKIFFDAIGLFNDLKMQGGFMGR